LSLFRAGATRREAMKGMAAAFSAAGVEDAASDGRRLLCAAADIDNAALIRDPDAALDDDALERLERFAARRTAREPVTRILGTRGFWSLDLDVAPDVLDPRPDSETVVDAALKHLGERQDAPLAVADLGSGSGALLCALLDVFEGATGLAVDLSPAACALSERNLRKCGFGARARVVRGDWSALDDRRFDLVVSNPPYIPSGDIAGLDPEVRDHDPALALDGGVDGLDAFRSLADALPRLMAPDGLALIEMGWDQAEAVEDLFTSRGFAFLGAERDLAGVPRVVALKRPAE
jgi:release factor glutamine methyltransferase